MLIVIDEWTYLNTDIPIAYIEEVWVEDGNGEEHEASKIVFAVNGVPPLVTSADRKDLADLLNMPVYGMPVEVPERQPDETDEEYLNRITPHHDEELR